MHTHKMHAAITPVPGGKNYLTEEDIAEAMTGLSPMGYNHFVYVVSKDDDKIVHVAAYMEEPVEDDLETLTMELEAVEIFGMSGMVRDKDYTFKMQHPKRMLH